MSCPQQPCSQNSRFDKSDFLYRESNAKDAKRYDTLYGVDPLSANILDRSIARTWPVSSWSITVSTNNTKLPWYPTLTYHPTANGRLTLPQDRQSSYSVLRNNIWRYGDYMITMNVQASTTSTQSDKLFTQYIKVAEFEPFANFWATSAVTVSSSFVADNTSILSQLISISSVPNANLNDNLGSCFDFVSGYAPNLTVYFVDSSNAHTFPISSYHWDFGDPYNEGPVDITDKNSNYYTVTNTSIDSGVFESPCWHTNTQEHSAVHTYIMPGTYNVSLTVQASCTNTADVCARYVNTANSKRFYIYVEEILPKCNSPIYASVSAFNGYTNAIGGVSGNSPTTVYFNASSIIAGSFPICRIDWDFGDGLTQTVTRRPLTKTTTQGLSVVNLSAYSYDLDDPRNFVVPHTYTNNTESIQSYDINISAYACNTNSMIQCSAFSLVTPIVPPILQARVDTKRLIGSRFDSDGNIIYIVEGQNNNTTYTVALCGELNTIV